MNSYFLRRNSGTLLRRSLSRNFVVMEVPLTKFCQLRNESRKKSRGNQNPEECAPLERGVVQLWKIFTWVLGVSRIITTVKNFPINILKKPLINRYSLSELSVKQYSRVVSTYLPLKRYSFRFGCLTKVYVTSKLLVIYIVNSTVLSCSTSVNYLKNFR